MSLDVVLFRELPEVHCVCTCGHKHKSPASSTVFIWHIPHDLEEMARRAGIQEALWSPDERGIFTAKQLIRPLTEGLELLRAAPHFFKLFNPSSGRGNYHTLIEFVEAYLAACKEYPETTIHISR